MNTPKLHFEKGKGMVLSMMVKEVTKVKHETTLTKNIVWNIQNKEYKVKNVPYVELDAEAITILYTPKPLIIPC